MLEVQEKSRKDNGAVKCLRAPELNSSVGG